MSALPADHLDHLPGSDPDSDMHGADGELAPTPQEPGPFWSRWPRPHIRDVAVFGAFVAIFAAALRPVVDNDVFWHLATGRYIWQTGRIPHADPFSWTVPGRAWIAHEWGTEAWLYPLFVHGGYAALMLVFAAVIAGAFALSYATARFLGASRTVGVGVSLLAAVASGHTWGVRPQMLSLLLMGAALLILTRATTTGRTRILWALPPLMALWVNLHGGFIFGLALIGMFALGQTLEAVLYPSPLAPRGDELLRVGEQLRCSPTQEKEIAEGCALRTSPPPDKPGHERGWASPAPAHGRVGWAVGPARLGCRSADRETNPKRSAGPRDQSEAKRGGRGEGVRSLWLALGASVAACLLNPNGLKGLLYPFSYLGNNASTRYIAEWVSPDFHQPHYLLFEALLLLLIVGIAMAERRPRVTEVLLAIAFTYLALDSVRNINLFSVVIAPFIAVYLSSAWRRLRGRSDAETIAAARRPVVVPTGKAVINVLFAIAVAAAAVGLSLPNLGARPNLKAQAARYPAGAVAYLQAHHPAGPMLNSYDWGGYLIWHLYPRMRVYIDGRPDMYGDQFVDTFVQTWHGAPGWQARLRRQGVRLVLVEPSSGLAHALAGTRGWRLIYHDKVSVLYERTA